MSDPEKNVSNEQSGDIESEDFVNPEVSSKFNFGRILK